MKANLLQGLKLKYRENASVVQDTVDAVTPRKKKKKKPKANSPDSLPPSVRRPLPHYHYRVIKPKILVPEITFLFKKKTLTG